ncbi:MAG: fasciclin domain-containing protein [Planctomycetota bacterium]
MDTAVAADFDTLAAALTAADLVDALKGEGPFTVFAPTDQAFENLPDGALADLLKPENKAQLQAVLKFHVVAGRHMAADLVELESVETLQGEELALNFEDETLTVGGAEVTSADVECSNGVIHVINKVLLP